jgi:hypothetical protein
MGAGGRAAGRGRGAAGWTGAAALVPAGWWAVCSLDCANEGSSVAAKASDTPTQPKNRFLLNLISERPGAGYMWGSRSIGIA